MCGAKFLPLLLFNLDGHQMMKSFPIGYHHLCVVSILNTHMENQLIFWQTGR